MPSGGHNKVYSPEVAERVLSLMREGKILSDIAQVIGVDVETIQTWRMKYPTFGIECSRAQELGFEVQADSLHTIPDTYDDVQRAKLKSENLKWLLARRAAHKYGDRLDINLNQTIDIAAALSEGRRRALPKSDQDDIEDAQLVDPKQIEHIAPSGHQADAAISSSQDGDATDLASDDIFS